MGTLYTPLVGMYISATILETNFAKCSKDEKAPTLTTQKSHFLEYTLEKLFHQNKTMDIAELVVIAKRKKKELS